MSWSSKPATQTSSSGNNNITIGKTSAQSVASGNVINVNIMNERDTMKI